MRSSFFWSLLPPCPKYSERGEKWMLAKVSNQNFNCLEVTGIASKRFAGVPYTIVSGHRRHIQQGWRLEQGTAQNTT